MKENNGLNVYRLENSRPPPTTLTNKIWRVTLFKSFLPLNILGWTDFLFSGNNGNIKCALIRDEMLPMLFALPQ